jgi:hypothetical protein
MISPSIRRSLITGSQPIVTYNGRNPQPVIGKDPGTTITLGHTMFLGLAPSRH